MRTELAKPWTGMVPVDDTALSVEDSGGAGPAVVYLNGAYAGRRHWRPVIAELGDGFRHIGYDERARGGSGRSADYSFAGCLRGLDAVLDATGAERPLLVGWSFGALIAAHYAALHPERVRGVVAVDGALPYGLTGAEGQERIRTLFARMSPLLPLVRPFGLAAKMSAAQHAEVNIEANELHAALAPVLQQVRVPMRYVLATGKNLGGGAEEMEAARASLDPVLAANPHLRVAAKVASNHSHILRKDFRAVADAVRTLS